MKRVFFIMISMCFLSFAFSQNLNDSLVQNYEKVIPEKHFKAGPLHRFFFGSHWRNIWTTPVRVPVLNVEKYAGGLTPTEKGGGLQTVSLKFKGADGKEYKFRPLNKDPKSIKLSEKSALAKNLLHDQISALNPYAVLVTNPMLDAVGVYHPNDILVVLPDEETLGSFRNEFGNKIGMIETVPDEKDFNGADKVTGSIKMLDKLNEDFNADVDGKEFLKARLMDSFMGDRDRHKDQWKWAAFKQNGKVIYKPIPIDRDDAFTKLDGFFPSLFRSYFDELSNFGEDYPSVLSITWQARYLDQRFLAFLSRKEWEEVTNEVYSKLTDSLIENAVRQLPPEVYHKANSELTLKLKSRRNKLKAFSHEYYLFVNKVVDIYTTDKDDYVEIKSLSHYQTEVAVYKKNKEPASDKSEALKNKVFDNRVTDEIRIYLQDGDDEVVVSNSPSLPEIRVIGGKGKDEINNYSDQTIRFYDHGDKTKIRGNVNWDDENYKMPYDSLRDQFKNRKDKLTEKEKDEYEEKIGNLRYDPVLPPDKFSTTNILPAIDYSSDIGFSFGVKVIHKKYGFRMNPYLYSIRFTPDYSPIKNNITGLGLDLNADFLGIVKNAVLNFNLRKSGIEIINYFGNGNETAFNDSLYNAGYYKVEHELYSFNPTLTFPRDSKFKIMLGFIVKNFDIKDKPGTLITLSNPFGSDDFSSAGSQVGIEFDSRDNKTAPYHGFYFSATGNYFPKVFSNKSQFAKVTADARAYIGYVEKISLVLRLKGEKIFGDLYPFFESAFLGGSKSLRGYSRERFAGDASLLANAELRLRLAAFHVLIPVTLGIFTFGDSGRIFSEDELSKRWHFGYGGGLFMHFVNRDLTLKFTLASSKEQSLKFYVNTGFVF